MVNFGEIIEVSDYSARVRDLESGAETDWLCILYPLVGSSRVHWPAPALGSRVGYLEQGETGGVILGGIYDAANEATGSDDAVTISLFGFDITITATGIEAGATTEPATKGTTLKTLVENFVTALNNHVHLFTTPSGPVGTPDPASRAAFLAFSSGMSGTLATKVKVE